MRGTRRLQIHEPSAQRCRRRGRTVRSIRPRSVFIGEKIREDEAPPKFSRLHFGGIVINSALLLRLDATVIGVENRWRCHLGLTNAVAVGWRIMPKQFQPPSSCLK